MTENTTHTVRYESPHPLSALPMNKWAQFLFGLLIIFVAFKMAWAGWFSRDLFGIQPDPADGMGSPIGLLPFLIDGVCFVGILGFALVAFIRDAVGPLFAGLGEWMATTSAENAAALASRQTAKTSAGSVAGSTAGNAAPAAIAQPTKRRLDPERVATKFRLIADAVNNLHARVDALEQLHPEVLPPPAPEPMTAEEMAATIRELSAKLAAIQHPASAETEPEPAETITSTEKQ